MAMQFARAQQAQNPDLAQALVQQTNIANNLKAQENQAKQQNRQSYMQGGAMLAQAAPDGTFTNAWDVASGAQTAGEVAPVLAEDAAIGEMMAGAAQQEALGAGVMEGAGLMEGAAAAESAAAAAAATEAAAAGTAAAGATGASAGLAAMGPVGWGALAALAASQLL